MIVRTGIGHDSHRFLSAESSKLCILGGVIFEDVPGLAANSDGDVLLHAICNAVTSVSGVTILGVVADELMKKDGITDSQVYAEKALETLGKQKITHVALSVEAKRPRFLERVEEVRASIARIMKLTPSQVGLSATSGEGLTDFGCGDGIQAFCIITTVE